MHISSLLFQFVFNLFSIGNIWSYQTIYFSWIEAVHEQKGNMTKLCTEWCSRLLQNKGTTTGTKKYIVLLQLLSGYFKFASSVMILMMCKSSELAFDFLEHYIFVSWFVCCIEVSSIGLLFCVLFLFNCLTVVTKAGESWVACLWKPCGDLCFWFLPHWHAFALRQMNMCENVYIFSVDTMWKAKQLVWLQGSMNSLQCKLWMSVWISQHNMKQLKCSRTTNHFESVDLCWTSDLVEVILVISSNMKCKKLYKLWVSHTMSWRLHCDKELFS